METYVLPVLTCITPGLALVIYGYYVGVQSRKLLASGIPADGEVVEIIYSKSTFIVVKYKTMDGEWLTKRYRFGVIKDEYKLGQKVPVVYDQGDHKKYLIDDGSPKMSSKVYMFLGIFIMLLFAILYFATRK